MTNVSTMDLGPRTPADWTAIANNPKFVELHKRKRRFLIGWWIFSTVYYVLLSVLVGLFPKVASIKILGPINFGYFFAVSQFFVSWAIAILYAVWANKVADRLTEELVAELKPAV